MKRGEIAKTPIIALTANTSEEDVKKCLKCGMQGHLSKPLLKENLLKCIAKFD